MSTFNVPIIQITEILPHENADRLTIAKAFDWNVIVQKDKFKVNDIAVYIPVDSILSEALEARLFTPESKIKLKNRRIRSIRIRGVISQGMLIHLDELKDLNLLADYEIGD